MRNLFIGGSSEIAKFTAKKLRNVDNLGRKSFNFYNKNFIVNVGDSIIVKKTSKQAKEFMDKQIGELKRFQTRLLTEIQSLTLQANYLEKELMESIK